MKVAFFIPSLGGGGAERMFARMATYFASLGHAVDMVLMNAAKVEYRDELSDAVRIVDLKMPRLWTSLLAFRHYLKHEKPDVVISAMPLANGIAAWARRLTRYAPPVVLTEHNAVSLAFGDLDVPRYRPLMWVIRPSYRFADAIVAVAGGVAKRLRTVPGVKNDRIHVIYNPAWCPEMEVQAREQISHPWLLQKDVPVVVAIGRLEAQKDFATLLNAFAKIRKKRQVRLVLLGEGSLRASLERLAQELGVSDDLSMPCFVENPVAYLSRAIVFVLSSLHEGLPTVLIEAMTCATPVVCTDCPSGPAEILEGGRYGPQVPVGDAYALAAAIERQLAKPTPPDLLRARAREFSVEVSAGAYLKLIEDLCARA
jgi:glycosyltransferase involved in cell wall biosynthesis